MYMIVYVRTMIYFSEGSPFSRNVLFVDYWYWESQGARGMLYTCAYYKGI